MCRYGRFCLVGRRLGGLCGQDFEFVEHKLNWGEDRVWLRGEDRGLFSMPAYFPAASPALFSQ